MKKAPHLPELLFTLVLFGVGFLVCPPARTPAQQEPDRQLVQGGSAPARTVNRFALVIGNGAYNTAPRLRNPPNDARDMTAALTELGFEVTTGINVSQIELKRQIRGFGRKLKAGGSGVFFYAGHGVQSKGRNYLIPVEADIHSEADVEDAAVDLNLLLSYLDEAQNGLNIVILDACRNNPFARGFRSASTGLAQVEAPTGTLIAYATAPGRVAADGMGENGLYTSELLKQMRVPGIGATEMFMRVRAEVMKRTANQQVPWEASSLVGTFYFNERKATSESQSASMPNEDKFAKAFELSYWDSIKNSNDIEDFKAYLSKYPEGQFAALARNNLRRLERAVKMESIVPTTKETVTESAATVATKKDNTNKAVTDRSVSTVAVIVFIGKESYSVRDKTWIRFNLSVTNYALFPDDMFGQASDLPPCGRNSASSRTWVDIYDLSGKRLYGFCNLKSNAGLIKLWFVLPEGQTPPSSVYLVLNDRRLKREYKSAPVAIP